MPTKSELQEQVEALGVDPKGMTKADMESLLAEQANNSDQPDPKEETTDTVETDTVEEVEVEEAEEVVAGPAPEGADVDRPSTNLEEEAPAPTPKKSMMDRPKSFTQSLEECAQKCADFINKGGDESEMRKYLKSVAES